MRPGSREVGRTRCHGVAQPSRSREVAKAAAASAKAQARMDPLEATEKEARADLQALLDRKTFLADPPMSIRDEVAEAQSMFDAFKAWAESQLQ